MLLMFFGPDGSGKSTLARRIALLLASKGIKVKISWIRGTHTFASIMARFLSKFSSFKGNLNPYYEINIPSKLRSVWQTIEFISMLPIWIFMFIIPSFMGYTIVGERSLVDFIIWISMTTQHLSFINSFLGRISLALTLKNSLNIYIRADLETLMSRRREEQSLLPIQLILYDFIGIKVLNSPTVDTTSSSIEESTDRLLSIIYSKLEAGK